MTSPAFSIVDRLDTPRQDRDGTAHFAFFDVRTQASFTWDGDSERIDVSLGGYGEPVDHHLYVSRLDQSFAQPKSQLIAFADICNRHALDLPDYGSNA